MKTTFLSLILLCFLSSSAQEKIKTKRRPVFDLIEYTAQYEFGNVQNFNIGIKPMSTGQDGMLGLTVISAGPTFEVGLGRNDGKSLLLTKVGFECFYFIVGGRFSVLNYSDFVHNVPLYRPEVGGTFFKYMTLTYGYNFPVAGKDYFDAEGHLLSLNIAWPVVRKYYKTERE